MTTTTITETTGYDYRATVIQDIEDWIGENHANYDSMDAMREACEPIVTGLDTGSYVYSAWQARDYITRSGFIFGGDWEEFLLWLDTMSLDIAEIIRDPTDMDTIIRLFHFDEWCWDEASTGIEDKD
ncbi:hypothetical protein [Bifidobacterium callimiconis]|uniref:Uncharacterized protein n=1 Tax=Bifidobacterium callimiconis TaxID=2306973 RepID=A0A430FBT8_9BIFI|nr:hypothetical protein [Bifidobacterium callimiconis]RSX50271.1 hypothetical protein D2E23_1819 [Bifidobacterium callimiconis]